MALKSTIFKATLAVADIDNGYYADHAVTLARHPSETDERMMVRLVALARYAHMVQTVCGGDAHITFGKGLSSPDDPDVIVTDFTGRKRLWIEVGQPDDRALAKASSQADAVVVLAYGNAAPIWWQGIVNKVSRLDRLSVWCLPPGDAAELANMAQRSMQLHATIQEGAITLGSDAHSLAIEPLCWKSSSSTQV